MTAPNNVASLAVVAGEENLLGEPSYKYLTADEMRGLGDDSMAIDVTHDEKQNKPEGAPPPPSTTIPATMVSHFPVSVSLSLFASKQGSSHLPWFIPNRVAADTREMENFIFGWYMGIF